MATHRLLVKLALPKAMVAARESPFAARKGLAIERLFVVPPPVAESGQAFADGETGWYLATIEGEAGLGLDGGDSPWAAAHKFRRDATSVAPGARLLAVEPDLQQSWIEPPPGLAFAAEGAVCEPTPQDPLPLAKGPVFAWHLGDNFSRLKKARDATMASGADVTIAHLDTGYDPDQKGLKGQLDLSRQRNFVDKGKPNDATDSTPPSGFLKHYGHGTGTLGTLVGGKLQGMRPDGTEKDENGRKPYDGFNANTGDWLGGAPKAKVVPVRVANSVVQLWTSTVAQGIDYARAIGADVISMSLGGLPSGAWADAVNAAYEAGVVIVCAAGNNFGGLPMSALVWPARFNRAIAACGIMADRRPYYGMPMRIMQGNYGPPSRMGTAVAAFTPNVPWLRIGCPDVVDLDGAGTSSATPQIAATAALWLRRHKASLSYPRPWMKAEAVRQALFRSAQGHAEVPHEFFGAGVLEANAALAVKPKESELKIADADRGWFGFLAGLGGQALAEDPARALYQIEITQLALKSRSATAEIPDPDDETSPVNERKRLRFYEAILDETTPSPPLRRHLESLLGRGVGRPPPEPPPRPGDGSKPKTGSELPRRKRHRPPSRRRLQIFAIDPGSGAKLETAFINKTVADVRWESAPGRDSVLAPGPVGEYVEVVDVDPASGCAYEPVNLDDPLLLAQNGLAPSEGNPQFHQQMVYAVAMRTIETFEEGLGRRALWAPKRISKIVVDPRDGREKERYEERYVPRLRIYPHALRQANAYYSPDKVALLFGYFPAWREAASDGQPGHMVFTCLSHDIIAHETTHALLDGLHRRFQEASNPDVLAFHEAFADIVAIFQHFTLPELLRYDIARTRGDLKIGELMSNLAHEFGEALGRSKALRSAIGVDPAKTNYANTKESHERGSILVAAVFDAFLKIYQRRVDDLLRIATGGTGILRPGAIHPELVDRLADEAAKTARHVLTICIRALDYCPPVDITFGDYLRALITADADLVGVDKYGYRVAFLESFRARGIETGNVRTLSVESLQWASPQRQMPRLGEYLSRMNFDWTRYGDRRRAFENSRDNAAILHEWLEKEIDEEMAVNLGLNRNKLGKGPDQGFRPDEENRPRFEVHAVRPAHRVSPDGVIRSTLVVVLTQRRRVAVDPEAKKLPPFDARDEWFWFRGGSTLIIDPADREEPIRYAIVKSIWSKNRARWQQMWRAENLGLNLRSLYFGAESGTEENEPFALLHVGD
jgi:hypothetical protein